MSWHSASHRMTCSVLPVPSIDLVIMRSLTQMLVLSHHEPCLTWFSWWPKLPLPCCSILTEMGPRPWLKIQLCSTTSEGLTPASQEPLCSQHPKYGVEVNLGRDSTHKTRTTRQDDEATKEEHSEEGDGDDDEGHQIWWNGRGRTNISTS